MIALTLLNFWRAQAKRGDKLRSVHAVISMGGAQPVGYMIAWSVNKRAAYAEADKRSNAGLWVVVKITPHPDTFTAEQLEPGPERTACRSAVNDYTHRPHHCTEPGCPVVGRRPGGKLVLR